MGKTTALARRNRLQRSIIAPAERVTNLRWGIAVLLGIGVLVNYFDRVNLTVAEPALRAEFGIDHAGFGLVLSAFAWSYALRQIPVELSTWPGTQTAIERGSGTAARRAMSSIDCAT